MDCITCRNHNLNCLFSLSHQSEAIQTKPYDIWLILPYLAVFFLAFTRLHVLAVLMIGVVLSGMMGLLNKPDFHLLQLNNSIYNGFIGMFEVALLSMLLGGLSALMQKLAAYNG